MLSGMIPCTTPRLSITPSTPVCATSIESPLEKRSLNIPTCYAPFSDVFCPKRVTQLPPHRPQDCAIDLIPGDPVPHGRIYLLSIPEQKAMEEYIEKALHQGYIWPSKSLLLRAYFLSPRKMEVCWPALITEPLTPLLSSSVTHFPSFQLHWTTAWSCRVD